MATRITQGFMRLLTDIADYRIVSLSQVAHLHFSGKRSARRRMQQLEKDGLAVHLPGPTVRRGGRPEKVYGLSQKGLELVNSDRVKIPRLSIEQAGGEKLGHQTGHQLLLNWCRVHLVHLSKVFPRVEHRLLSSNSPFALDEESGLSIAADRVLLPEDESPVRFTPDAVFILTDTQQPKSVLLILEVDMGTEPLANGGSRDIQEKVRRYQQYFRSEQYKKYEQLWDASLNGFRLLFIANSSARFQSLNSVVRTTPPSDFVWVTSEERMFAEGISGAIWARAGVAEQAPESILDSLSLPMPLPELTE